MKGLKKGNPFKRFVEVVPSSPCWSIDLPSGHHRSHDLTSGSVSFVNTITSDESRSLPHENESEKSPIRR